MGKLIFLCIVLLSIAIGGCAAPGSRVGQVGLSGKIENKGEHIEIRALLPKAFGLGGLDIAFGKPEDYGRTDEMKGMMVAADGAFEIIFDPLVYHTGFWLLPPIGFYPKYPPNPAFAIQISTTPSEIYLLGTRWESFRYSVVRIPGGKEVAAENASWTLTGDVEKTEFGSGEKKYDGKLMRVGYDVSTTSLSHRLPRIRSPRRDQDS